MKTLLGKAFRLKHVTQNLAALLALFLPLDSLRFAPLRGAAAAPGLTSGPLPRTAQEAQFAVKGLDW